MEKKTNKKNGIRDIQYKLFRRVNISNDRYNVRKYAYIILLYSRPGI